MKFSLEKTIEILERTPHTLKAMLYTIGDEWSRCNEGGDTWSAYDVVGHLIHCEECNWIQRIEIVLSDSVVRKFEPLDRFAQMQKSKGKTLEQLLDEFVTKRTANIAKLKSLHITEKQLSAKATHPELGEVTLSQLISTWTVHDLDHLSQISRVMAKQYKEEIGPWIQYMRIINQ